MLGENTPPTISTDSGDLSYGTRELTTPSPNSGSYGQRFGTLPIYMYIGFELAYVFFNHELFEGLLPPCLITLQRTRGAYGYYSNKRFVNVENSGEITDEIALNPAHFAKHTPAFVLSVLVHEMTHCWQFHFGKPSRGVYHNEEWAAKMDESGLVPSHTGKPGGKRTGERMGHYIREDGPFDRACRAYLARDTTVLYQDRAYRVRGSDGGAVGGDAEEVRRGEEAVRRAKQKTASKTKYTCVRHNLNAWAKPGVPLVCGYCVKAGYSETEMKPA